ncbi:MAG: hypothetical protein HY288_07435 [Planctomycetia bacterium]|nr:hypothetical protein [Planctomycetia bacterium]
MMDNVDLQNGAYGNRATVTASWSEPIERYLKDHELVELELNMAKGWVGKDLAFLKNLPGLKSFEILDLHIRDIEPIHCLHKLLTLGITTYCSTPIRFSEFPQLRECALEWRQEAESLFDCKTLTKLFVNRYSGLTTDVFARLTNLEHLTILNSPVHNLHGLSALTKLKSLRLGNLRRLESLAGLETLCNLEDLEVHTCKRIGSVEQIGHLTRLRRLNLNNDGAVESLRPLNNLKLLEMVVFYESTNILDGDLSPLLRQKHLSRVSFKDRRHYSNRRKEFSAVNGG